MREEAYEEACGGRHTRRHTRRHTGRHAGGGMRGGMRGGMQLTCSSPLTRCAFFRRFFRRPFLVTVYIQ